MNIYIYIIYIYCIYLSYLVVGAGLIDGRCVLCHFLASPALCGWGGVGKVGGGVATTFKYKVHIQSMRAQRARAHVSIILYTVKACKCF